MEPVTPSSVFSNPDFVSEMHRRTSILRSDAATRCSAMIERTIVSPLSRDSRRVLTLVIATDNDTLLEESIDAANAASHEHPSRVIAVTTGHADATEAHLDAQLRVGGDSSAGRNPDTFYSNQIHRCARSCRI